VCAGAESAKMNTGLLRYEESVLSRPAKGYVRESIKVKSTELTRAVSIRSSDTTVLSAMHCVIL
jgi:hypothetical protein